MEVVLGNSDSFLVFQFFEGVSCVPGTQNMASSLRVIWLLLYVDLLHLIHVNENIFLAIVFEVTAHSRSLLNACLLVEVSDNKVCIALLWEITVVPNLDNSYNVAWHFPNFLHIVEWCSMQCMKSHSNWCVNVVKRHCDSFLYIMMQ